MNTTDEAKDRRFNMRVNGDVFDKVQRYAARMGMTVTEIVDAHFRKITRGMRSASKRRRS